MLGFVPDSFKLADLWAFYKGNGRRTQSSSYRAIFNLPFIVKVFEKVLYNRILLSVNGELDENQHGFRPNRSCETAIAIFTESIHKYLDKKSGKAVAVYIDFSKAELIVKLIKNLK